MTNEFTGVDCQVVERASKRVKLFYGMSSDTAMKK